MIGYMWVKYKYRIGIVFWRKTMHEHMQREKIRFQDNLSLISPLHCLPANPYWNLYLDFYCLSVCRWLWTWFAFFTKDFPQPLYLDFLHIMVLPCWHWGNQCIMIVEMNFNINIFGKWLHSQRENFMSQICLQCTVKIWIFISLVYIYQRDAHDDASMKRETLINCC